MSSASGVPIVLSSGTEDDILEPFSDEADVYEDVYDVDRILQESVRPVVTEHSNVPGLRLGQPCLHYLVKWAGYSTSQSSWIPVPLCSKSLVLLWKQHCLSTAVIARRAAAAEVAAAAEIAAAAVTKKAVADAAAAAVEDVEVEEHEEQLIHVLAAQLHEMKMSPRARFLPSLAFVLK